MMTLGSEDQILVARELIELVRTEPDGQDRVAEALQDLLSEAKLAAEIVRGLDDLDPASVRPGLIVRITQQHPMRDQAIALVRRWRESGRLSEVAFGTASKLLDEDSS